MKLILNNWTGFPIVYIVKDGVGNYYQAELEYWIVEWWKAEVDLSKGNLNDLYFEFLEKFKIHLNDLETAYAHIDNDLEKMGNRPAIVINFDQQKFSSNFFDQAIEKKMVDDWQGYYINEFSGIAELIPSNKHYWK